MQLVTEVLDYRAAQAAVQTFNQANKEQAFDALRANPRMVEILALMSRAQRGVPLDGGDLLREGIDVAQTYRSDPEETDGDAE